MATPPIIPKSVYGKFREEVVKRNMWVHYLFHCSVCLFKDSTLHGAYKTYTPKNWIDCYDSI